MIKIQDKVYDTNVEDIVDDLIDEFDVFPVRRTSGNHLMVQCPYHGGGNESHPSFGIDLDTGMSHCFTCGAVKNIKELCSDISGDENWLDEHCKKSSERQRLVLNFTRGNENKAEPVFLDKKEIMKYAGYHHYLLKRRIPKDIAQKYYLGYDKENDCIMFPILDYNGNLLYFASRSVKKKFYHYPKDVDKNLYGVYQLKKYFPDAKEVYITESMINCLTLASYGLPAIATQGCNPNETQIKDICKLPMRKIILSYDADNAGVKGTAKLAKKLKNKLVYTLIYTDSTKDINDLTEDEFRQLTTRLL